jgi:hypothetical protein
MFVQVTCFYILGSNLTCTLVPAYILYTHDLHRVFTFVFRIFTMVPARLRAEISCADAHNIIYFLTSMHTWHLFDSIFIVMKLWIFVTCFMLLVVPGG